MQAVDKSCLKIKACCVVEKLSRKPSYKGSSPPNDPMMLRPVTSYLSLSPSSIYTTLNATVAAANHRGHCLHLCPGRRTCGWPVKAGVPLLAAKLESECKQHCLLDLQQALQILSFREMHTMKAQEGTSSSAWNRSPMIPLRSTALVSGLHPRRLGHGSSCRSRIVAPHLHEHS